MTNDMNVLPPALELTPDDLADLDEEVATAAMVMFYRAARKMTNSQIAVALGVDRTTLWRWEKNWEQNGVASQAKKFLMAPRLQEIQQAAQEVLAAWPEILRETVKIALGERKPVLDKDGRPMTNRDGAPILEGGPSFHVRLEAAALLRQWVVDPMLTERSTETNAETDYSAGVRKDGGLDDPLKIPQLLQGALKGT